MKPGASETATRLAARRTEGRLRIVGGRSRRVPTGCRTPGLKSPDERRWKVEAAAATV